MSKRAVLVLAAVVAALLGYILVFERESITSKELAQRSGRVLSTFVRERVDRLELQRKNKRVVLERTLHDGDDFGEWKMREPDAVEADQDTVDQVLGELEWLTARRTLENVSAEDLERFGLKAPRFRVWYRVAGEKHLLTVGAPDVHGEGVYVRIDDEPHAHVVPKTLTEALDREPWAFRTKEFLGNIVIGWARRIELEGEGQPKLTLAREDTERWWYEGDLRTYADEEHIDKLLTGLDDLRATRFITEGEPLEQAQASLKTPAQVVRVRIVPDVKREDQEPRLVELRVGGACPGQAEERVAQAGSQGPVVCVKADDLKPLSGEAESYRQAELLGVEPSRVERIELSGQGKKLALKRDGEKWLGEGDKPVDREAVEQWLSDLRKQRALGFFAKSAFPEVAQLTLSLADQTQEVIAVGAVGPDRTVNVRRGEEPALLRFPAHLVELLTPTPARFASLEPWSAHQPSEVVAVSAREGGFERSLNLHEGAWRSDDKPLSASDDLRARELIKTLIKLRVRAFVTDKVRPEHGLSPARASVVLRLRATDAGAGKELKLEIGGESPNGHYARVDGGPVLEVTPQVLGQVRELAGGPPAPAAAAAEPSDDHDAFHDEHGHDHAH